MDFRLCDARTDPLASRAAAAHRAPGAPARQPVVLSADASTSAVDPVRAVRAQRPRHVRLVQRGAEDHAGHLPALGRSCWRGMPGSRLRRRATSSPSASGRPSARDLARRGRRRRPRRVHGRACRWTSTWRCSTRVDIALDTFPYGGGTTTFDSLWMGVPVVATVGDTPVSRSAASILASLGLDDWIAPSIDDYVDLVVARAADRAGRRGAAAHAARAPGGVAADRHASASRATWSRPTARCGTRAPPERLRAQCSAPLSSFSTRPLALVGCSATSGCAFA